MHSRADFIFQKIEKRVAKHTTQPMYYAFCVSPQTNGTRCPNRALSPDNYGFHTCAVHFDNRLVHPEAVKDLHPAIYARGQFCTTTSDLVYYGLKRPAPAGGPAPKRQRLVPAESIVPDYNTLEERIETMMFSSADPTLSTKEALFAMHRYIEYRELKLQWLNDKAKDAGIYIQHAGNGAEYRIPGTNWVADGYCAEINTLYFLYSCDWHGCPDCEGDNYLPLVGKNAEDASLTVYERERILEDAGYKVVSEWQCDAFTP